MSGKSDAGRRPMPSPKPSAVPWWMAGSKKPAPPKPTTSNKAGKSKGSGKKNKAGK